MTAEIKTNQSLNAWKVALSCITWTALYILGAAAIQGFGSMQTNYPNAFEKWQWKAFEIFMFPFVYPIMIYGLPIYISGIIPIIISRLQDRRAVD